ncbi:MAG: hypothetical protein ACE5H4_06660 [Candidatus Thorarchaeota archaeon]
MTDYRQLILRIGILLIAVAGVFWVLLSFRIIPLPFSEEGFLINSSPF